MRKPIREVFVLLVVSGLAASTLLIMWLTLFSRIGSDSRLFYAPFKSYRAILGGSGRAVIEVIGNIVLFTPVGITAALIFGIKTRNICILSFILSLLIECCQWYFWLGAFECDDLIHNTIGALLGAVLINQTSLGKWLKKQKFNTRRNISLFILLILAVLIVVFSYQGIQWQKMKKLAAFNDRPEGIKNELVLNPTPKITGGSSIDVLYNTDGSILITGETQKKAWIELGKIKLKMGKYLLSGLPNIEGNTVFFALDYFVPERRIYKKLIRTAAHTEDIPFELQNDTKVKLRVYIRPDTSCEIVARPAIYRVTGE